MRLTTRFFEISGQQYRLVAFEVLEDGEVAFPDGSLSVHNEPILQDGAIAGFDMWALVPTDSMAQVVNEVERP